MIGITMCFQLGYASTTAAEFDSCFDFQGKICRVVLLLPPRCQSEIFSPCESYFDQTI